MLASKEKISIRQAMIILLTIVYSPSLRFNLVAGAKEAKQAAWLAPIIALFFILPIIFILDRIYKNYKHESFMEVIEDIFGLVVGKTLSVLYIIFLTFQLGIVIYNYADKLVSTAYTQYDQLIFVAIMLFAVAYITRKSGLSVLARMSEILTVIIILVFLFFAALSFKDIKISNITPISYLDIFPAFKANLIVMSVWWHLPLMFLFSDYINNKEKIKKVCSVTILLLSFLSVLLAVTAIGILGATTIELSPVPYITMVKQLSVFGFVERMESIVLTLWIFSDFMMISLLIFIVFNIFKSLLKLSDTKPLISIYSLILFFIVMMFGRNTFEVQALGFSMIMPLNIFLGYIMPVLVFSVGMIRKKV